MKIIDRPAAGEGRRRYYYIVESHRSGDIVEKKTLEYLGRDPDPERLKRAIEYWGVTEEDRVMSELQRAERQWTGRLRRVGVKVLDSEGSHLRCMKCGQDWSPNIQTGGRMPARFWNCPNGCNVGKRYH